MPALANAPLNVLSASYFSCTWNKTEPVAATHNNNNSGILLSFNFDVQVISNSSDVSSLMKDKSVPGATGYGGEKYSICLCSAEKRPKPRWSSTLNGAGEGSEWYVQQVVYLESLPGAGNQLDGLRQHGKPTLAVCESSMQKGIHRVF